VGQHLETLPDVHCELQRVAGVGYRDRPGKLVANLIYDCFFIAGAVRTSRLPSRRRPVPTFAEVWKGVTPQSRLGRGCRNQLDDGGAALQWPAAPVLRDVAVHVAHRS
jgi:hypothetical protein